MAKQIELGYQLLQSFQRRGGNSMKRVLFLLFGTIFIFASTSEATLILVDPTAPQNVVGIENLIIGSDSYNVMFEKGLFNTVYNVSEGSGGGFFGAAPTWWGDASGAEAASVANNSAFEDGPRAGDYNIPLSTSNSWYLIPYAFVDSETPRIRTIVGGEDIGSPNEWTVLYTDIGLPTADPRVFAKFSPSQVPVPVPATVFLLGSGLIGLAGFRKKFRKR
jgi:hypothetical protein